MNDDFQADDFTPEEAPKKSMTRRAWEALAIPEQKSREGLKMLAGMIPNPEPRGGMAMDLLRGTPRIAADTVAEAAPGFISRGAILTAGASRLAGEAAPLAKGVLRAIGRQGEEMSGIAPKAEGALEAAYKDPTLIFSKGKKAAGQFYEAAKDEMHAGQDAYRATSTGADGVVNMEKTKDIFSGMYQPQEILNKAEQFVAGGGKLEPAEALKVRKSIDILLKSKQSVPDELYRLRGQYDAMAKASENLSAGDATYQRGLKAESLRNFFPQNKYGGASPFKTMILKLTGGAAAPLLSPAVQGAAATAAGVGARALSPFVGNGQNAIMVYKINEALNQALKKRRENAH